MHRTQNDGKVPFTRRRHVNHVIEGHFAIFSILKNILGDLNYYLTLDFDQDDELFIVGGKECLVEE